MFDDVVEHCGEGAHKYLSACFPAFVDGVTEVCCRISCTDVTLRQTETNAICTFYLSFRIRDNHRRIQIAECPSRPLCTLTR